VKKFCLVEYNGVESVESQPTFRRNILPLSVGSKSKYRNSSTLKTKATCSSETSVRFQRTVRRYTHEDNSPQLGTY
jgi:hypothetical protein